MSDRELKLRVVLDAIDKATGPLKAVMNGSSALSKAVKQAREGLKELENQQKLVDSFRSTNKAIGITAQDLEKARARVDEVRTAMQAAEYPTRQMQRAFEEATKTARHLAADVNRLKEKKQDLRQELIGVGIDTKKLSSAQLELKGRIDLATQALDRQQKALKENGAQMQRYYAAKAQAEKIRNFGSKAGSVAMGAGAAGAAVNAAVAFPIKAYADAEDAATQLKVAMMGVGGQVPATFTQINDLAGKLGDRLPGTTADYQNMMTMLLRQGMSAQAILGGLGEATAYLGVQLKMPMDAAAEFASKLQDATRTSEKDMMGLMDTIQRTFYLGVDSDNMLQAFSKLSPAMATIRRQGLDAANAFAPLIVMADQAGMKGEAAGNAYRKMFQYALDAKKLGKANAALKGTGIGLDFSDGKGEFGGMDKLFANLQKLQELDTMRRNGVIKQLFGDDAETLQVVSLMIDKGKAGYEEVQAKMAAQADIQARVNAQLNTLKSLWDAASGTFTNALVAFGESVAPELHATAEWLGRVAERTQAWAKENPGLASAIMTVAKWLGILLVGLAGIASVITAVTVPLAAFTWSLGFLGITLPTIGGTIAAFGGVLTTIFAAIKSHPIGLLIALVVYTIGYLITRWDELKAKFANGDWAGIGVMILQGIEAGLDAATFGLWSKVKNIGVGMFNSMKEALGIHSPSRVFAEIGTFTMAGLEQGLDDGGKGTLDTIGRITRQLTAAGVIGFSGAALASGFSVDTRGPVAAGVAAGVPVGGDHIEIHVHAAPGMDEQLLAGLVARELEKRDRISAVRRRSSLRDVD